MIFTDGTLKEGYFENNVYKYALGGGNPNAHSASSIKGASTFSQIQN